jgi:ABC-type oligopeptide transport system substrate-binding subunit
MSSRFILLALLILSACNQTPRDCPPHSDELRVSLVSLPNTLDWSRSNETSWVNYPVMHAMMRGLTTLDAQFKPAPGLAERWEVSLSNDTPPKQTYLFHLRKDLLWSDGKTPLRAKDFVLGWRRAIMGNEPVEMADLVGSDEVFALRESTTLPAGERSSKLEAALQQLGVEAVDDHTLKVTLKAPKNYFLSRLAFVYTFFPAPSADLEGKSEEEIRRYFDEPQGGKPMVIGAYTVSSWDRAAQTLTLSPNSFDKDTPKNKPQRLTLLHAELAPILYEQCKLDFYMVDDPSTLKDAPKDIRRQPLMSTYWLGMNGSKVPLKLRQAISFALKREALVEGLLPEARPAFGLLPSSLVGSATPQDPLAKNFPSFDQEKAKALLKESGYQGEELTLLVNSSETFLPETGIADAVKQQLAALGIKVRIQATSNFSGDIKAPDGSIRHELFLRRIGADYAHPQTFFTPFGARGQSYTSWQTLESGAPLQDFERLMAQGAAAEAPDEMKKFYTEAQTLLLSTYAVLVPIYHPDRYYRSRSWVAGLSIDPFNFLTLRDISVK